MNDIAISRRRAIELLIGVPTSAAVLAACGSKASTAVAATETATTGATAVPATATTAPAAAVPATATAVPATAAPATAAPVVAGQWASGGTNLISVAYPDTSIFDAATSCSATLMDATTLGPCYFASDTGEDISLGNTGLPMQLCLQLRDTACAPLAGYIVEVWHCDTRGTYSGDTSGSASADSFAGDFCTGGDEEAANSTFYRGQLTTDAEGRVNFKTTLPGWYSSRTIHIHLAITDPDGTTRLVSQFCFEDALTEEICTTHDEYVARGIQDTPLANGGDTVFGTDYEDFLLDTQQNADGSLLAYAVVEMDPTAVATGGAPGGGGGGGRGAPPPRPEDS